MVHKKVIVIIWNVQYTRKTAGCVYVFDCEQQLVCGVCVCVWWVYWDLQGCFCQRICVLCKCCALWQPGRQQQSRERAATCPTLPHSTLLSTFQVLGVSYPPPSTAGRTPLPLIRPKIANCTCSPHIWGILWGCVCVCVFSPTSDELFPFDLKVCEFSFLRSHYVC